MHWHIGRQLLVEMHERRMQKCNIHKPAMWRGCFKDHKRSNVIGYSCIGLGTSTISLISYCVPAWWNSNWYTRIVFKRCLWQIASDEQKCIDQVLRIIYLVVGQVNYPFSIKQCNLLVSHCNSQRRHLSNV